MEAPSTAKFRHSCQTDSTARRSRLVSSDTICVSKVLPQSPVRQNSSLSPSPASRQISEDSSTLSPAAQQSLTSLSSSSRWWRPGQSDRTQVCLPGPVLQPLLLPNKARTSALCSHRLKYFVSCCNLTVSFHS